MTALILGAGGLLGQCLARDLAPLPVIALARAECDITAPESLAAALQKHQPAWLINAAGFLNVDRCEREPENSYAVNARGVHTLIEAIRQHNARATQPVRLIHFSTDFVFDGVAGGYAEDALPNPVSRYGQHKWLADEMILASALPDFWILRIASVVGFHADKPNFIKNMVKLSATRPELKIVDDLKVSVTTTEFLAEMLHTFRKKNVPSGLYNLTGSGIATWQGLAALAFESLGIETPVLPTTIDQMKNDAPRPLLSYLDNTRLAAITGPVPDWQNLVRAHLEKYRAAYMDVRRAAQEAAKAA